MFVIANPHGFPSKNDITSWRVFDGAFCLDITRD